MTTAEAIIRTLESPNVSDSNGEAANIVDAIDGLSRTMNGIRKAITPASALAGEDAAGGHIESLTEAVMGVTAGLCRIAEAITELAEAVRERNRS